MGRGSPSGAQRARTCVLGETRLRSPLQPWGWLDPGSHEEAGELEGPKRARGSGRRAGTQALPSVGVCGGARHTPQPLVCASCPLSPGHLPVGRIEWVFVVK